MNPALAQLSTILKFTYGIVPIVAGLDKHINLLTDWGKYIPSGLLDALPMEPETLMTVVGPIEIIAGILVLLRPKIGALVVAIWLTLIALVLILGGVYFDVAVRDLVMAIGAYGLFSINIKDLE
ncbi:hypothetical protein [Flagellimonas myxillae]|uniref:hypothetical protein n=1 Tax=Flagellimonas myxillae TaxID=2942214 RepID=UPI00201E8676|nr:hypothetical protein [Muricauda myxillae]MCL6266162.1 hypothetical protein [Muricauda myxillae]